MASKGDKSIGNSVSFFNAVAKINKLKDLNNSIHQLMVSEQSKEVYSEAEHAAKRLIEMATKHPENNILVQAALDALIQLDWISAAESATEMANDGEWTSLPEQLEELGFTYKQAEAFDDLVIDYNNRRYGQENDNASK